MVIIVIATTTATAKREFFAGLRDAFKTWKGDDVSVIEFRFNKTQNIVIGKKISEIWII